jgi:acetyl-CoA synthetase (ADP-forming)
MRTPAYRVARSASEAASIASEIGFPVVLKIVSRDILHKTEVGGVILALRTRDEVTGGYDQILTNVTTRSPKAAIEGVLVQAMAPAGLEVIVGGLRDTTFGPTVLFGLGGIFVEVLKDASFRVAPVTELDSRQMIEEIHGYQLLKGVRGQPASDETSVIRILQAMSNIMVENDQIAQVDLNPVIVYPKGAEVVDARILLA